MSSINSCGTKLLLANVYGPCLNSEKYQFLLNLKYNIEDNMLKFNTNNIAVFGNFNIVKNNDLGIISGNPHSEETVYDFNTCIRELLLIDIWREHNKKIKNSTWSCKAPSIARRLDYIFYLT